MESKQTKHGKKWKGISEDNQHSTNKMNRLCLRSMKNKGTVNDKKIESPCKNTENRIILKDATNTSYSAPSLFGSRCQVENITPLPPDKKKISDTMLNTSKMRKNNVNLSPLNCKMSLNDARTGMDCFVYLHKIDEYINNRPERKGDICDSKPTQKTCVYKNIVVTPTQEMLPEQRSALYDFLVDVNEQKIQKKKPTRKRKVKKWSRYKNCNPRLLTKKVKDILPHVSCKIKHADNEFGLSSNPSHNNPGVVNTDKQCEKTNENLDPTLNMDVIVSKPMSSSSNQMNTSPVKQVVPSVQGISSVFKTPKQMVTQEILLERQFSTPISTHKVNTPMITPIKTSILSGSNMFLKAARPTAYVSPNFNISPDFGSNDSLNVGENMSHLIEAVQNINTNECKLRNPNKLDESLPNSNLACKTNATLWFSSTPAKKVLSPVPNSSSKEILDSVTSSAKVLPTPSRFVTMRRQCFPHIGGELPAPVSCQISPSKLNINNFFGFESEEESDDEFYPMNESSNCKVVIESNKIISQPVRQKVIPQASKLKDKLRSSLTQNPPNKPISGVVSLPSTIKIDMGSTPCASCIPPEEVHTHTVKCHSLDTGIISQADESSTTMVHHASPLLFTDDLTAPVHFTKPPRRSYDRSARRKRPVFPIEDDLNSEEEENLEPLPSKRKKRMKNYKKKEEIVRKWIANINFKLQEVAEFQLCVE